MKQLKKTKRPVVLTVKGKAAAIVQDAEAYQRLLDIAARAAPDLARLSAEIEAEHSDAALKWYRGLKQLILSLEESPIRCPMTPGSGKLRHLLYGRKPHIYRAIYRVLAEQRQVDVLHIRHGAR